MGFSGPFIFNGFVDGFDISFASENVASLSMQVYPLLDSVKDTMVASTVRKGDTLRIQVPFAVKKKNKRLASSAKQFFEKNKFQKWCFLYQLLV